MKNFDQIDDYLLGNLESSELDAFEKQLQNDMSLKKSVQEQQRLLRAVDTLGDLRMQKRIKAIHEQNNKKKSGVRRINIRLLAMAAIGLVAVGLCLWMFLRPPLNERLYADFYEPHTITFADRSNDVDRQLVEASRFYKNGDFNNATLIFEKYISNDATDDKLLLAAGICAMELNHNDKAVNYFNGILGHEGSPYTDHANWYLALTSLDENNIVDCKKYLEKLILKKEGYFYNRASALLGRL